MVEIYYLKLTIRPKTILYRMFNRVVNTYHELYMYQSMPSFRERANGSIMSNDY